MMHILWKRITSCELSKTRIAYKMSMKYTSSVTKKIKAHLYEAELLKPHFCRVVVPVLSISMFCDVFPSVREGEKVKHLSALAKMSEIFF